MKNKNPLVRSLTWARDVSAAFSATSSSSFDFDSFAYLFAYNRILGTKQSNLQIVVSYADILQSLFNSPSYIFKLHFLIQQMHTLRTTQSSCHSKIDNNNTEKQPFARRLGFRSMPTTSDDTAAATTTTTLEHNKQHRTTITRVRSVGRWVRRATVWQRRSSPHRSPHTPNQCVCVRCFGRWIGSYTNQPRVARFRPLRTAECSTPIDSLAPLCKANSVSGRCRDIKRIILPVFIKRHFNISFELQRATTRNFNNSEKNEHVELWLSSRSIAVRRGCCCVVAIHSKPNRRFRIHKLRLSITTIDFNQRSTRKKQQLKHHERVTVLSNWSCNTIDTPFSIWWPFAPIITFRLYAETNNNDMSSLLNLNAQQNVNLDTRRYEW